MIKDLNKCKHLNGVSIEKKIESFILRDAIDKEFVCKDTQDGEYYLYINKKKLDFLLPSKVNFDRYNMKEFRIEIKRKYKKSLKND